MITFILFLSFVGLLFYINPKVPFKIGNYQTEIPLRDYVKFYLTTLIPKEVNYKEYPLKPRDEILKALNSFLILNEYFSIEKLKDIFGDTVKICVVENYTAFCKKFKINEYLHFYNGPTNLTIYMDKETLEKLVKIIEKRNENETLNFLIEAYINGRIIFKAT